MKEATGELSMTVVTIIAVIVIAAIVAALREPIINYINNQWGHLTNGDTEDNGTGPLSGNEGSTVTGGLNER